MPGFDIPSEELNSIGTVTVTGSIDTNEVKVAGTSTDVNSGLKSTGTQRVVLATDQPQLTNALKVDGSATTQPVSISGTVPVSGTVTANVGTTNGLALDATLTGGTQKTKIVDTAGTNVATVSAAGAVKTDSSATTQPVSAASLPLPAGASTSAKQAAPGTAGTPSADVLTVQGVTSMTALKVDGSGVTQPVSGTVTSNVGTTNGLALDATLTGGTAKVQTTDGTNVANVLKSDGTAAGQNSQLVAGTYKEVSFTTTTVQAVATTDVSNYSWVSVHVTSVGGSATHTAQCSNDNTNWVSCLLTNSTNTINPSASGVSQVAVYDGPLIARYFRINVTGIVSGTSAGTIEFYTVPRVLHTLGIVAAQTGTWTVQPGNTANTTAWKVDGSAVTQPVSGTVTANAGTNLNTSALALDATLTGGTQQAKVTDGTNIANVLKSDGTAAGQNSQMVAGSFKEISYTTTTAQAVASSDVSGYKWVSVQINSQGGSSLITFQGSNDNAAWTSVSLINCNQTSGTSAQTATSATGLYYGPVNFRFFRLNVTAIVSGTTAGTIELYTLPTSAMSTSVNVGSSTATGSAVPANAFFMGMSDATNLQPVKVAANGSNSTGVAFLATSVAAQFDDVSPTTIAENNFGNVRMSANRNVYETIRDAAGNERGANVTAANALVVDGSAVTQPTTMTDGTNIANTLKSDGTAAGQNAQLVAGTYKEVSFSTTTNQAVATTDVSNYSWVSIHSTSNGASSTNTVQCSNDNINWISMVVYQGNTTGSGGSVVINGVNIYHGPLTARYFRINVTGITSGTSAGVIEFYSEPHTLHSMGVVAVQSGTWTVQPGNTANTTPWLVTPAAGTTGGYSFNNITTATTTTVKSGAGTLHSIITNTTAASATVTIYDNTAGSGTKIGTTTNPISLLQMGPLTAIYDVAFATGLTIVTTGTQDITVTYK